MRSLGAPSPLVLASVLILALGYLIPRMAYAEVRVEGRTDSVRVDALEATVHEVLMALSAAFGLRVQNSAPLDQRVSGTYQGSLQQVISRLLSRRDYAARYSDGNLEIMLTAPRIGGEGRPVVGGPSAPLLQDVAIPGPSPAPGRTVDKSRLLFVPR